MSEERNDYAPKQKLPKNKKLTIVGVVVVVIVVAGMGFWTWHKGCGRIVGPFGPVRSSRVQSIRKKKGPRDAGAHR